MKILVSTLLTVCTLFVAPSLALYVPTDDVVILTPSNFHPLVVDDDAIWVVEFYAPWCKHCMALAAEFKKLATVLKGIVKVGSVNAHEYQSLGSRYGVPGFPTIKIFGANKNSPMDYDGAYTAEAMVEAALAEVNRKVYAALGYDISATNYNKMDHNNRWGTTAPIRDVRTHPPVRIYRPRPRPRGYFNEIEK